VLRDRQALWLGASPTGRVSSFLAGFAQANKAFCVNRFTDLEGSGVTYKGMSL
jgi:hypothetical protein